MKVSVHCHPESPLTGSTLKTLVKRATTLGRTYFSYTDQGHLSSCLKAYGLAKDNKLKFIPGIEIYFKDSQCQLTTIPELEKCNYYTGTLFCRDQESYQELCKMISREDFSTIEIYEENQQLWTWEHLEQISKFNVDFVAGGIHCMVSKPMLAEREDVGEKVLLKLKDIFKENLYTVLLCEPWVKKWSKVVEIKYQDDTRDTLLSTDYVSTDRSRKIKATDLAERTYDTEIKAKFIGSTYYEINKKIRDVKLHKGFLPLPGGDVTYRINRFLLDLSIKYNIKTLLTDYAFYAEQEDKIVQTMKLEGENKLHSNLHMKTDQEFKSYLISKLGLDEKWANSLMANTDEWADRYKDFKLEYNWRLANSCDDPLKMAMSIIKKNGRMRWNDPVWINRLKEELEVIAKNPKKDLTAYFLPIQGVLDHYKENGQLTGPGRGSAGGSLFCYLLGITQLNPFKYNLPFYRFFSLDRINTGKLPDIDVDLEDRDLLIGKDGKSGYLYQTWGNKAAQISTRSMVRLKSAIKDTNRFFNGKVEKEIEIFTVGLPTPPQGVNDHQVVFGYEDTDGNHIPGLIESSAELRKYIEQRPKEWEIVEKALGCVRSRSQHASAFLLSDIPISHAIPVTDGHITQYEAKECEAAGLIKYDFLVVKQLSDIRVCLDLINKRNQESNVVGYFTHQNQPMYIWDLPELDEVFHSIWTGQTETLFQINTRSMQPFVKDILPGSVTDLATILALVRPGPMDFIDEATGRNMVEEYVLRRRQESEPDIKELGEMLPETYGIIVYQEQLNVIARNIAGFSGEEAELLRENMAKKKMEKLIKMKPKFIEGASKKVSIELAEKIWERMVTFGRYGFSVIHATEYALITYACMFLKYYYPLEWWAAVLTNAEEKEITGKFWPFVQKMVKPPDINLSGDAMSVDYANKYIRAKIGVIRGLGEKTIGPIVNNRPYKDIQDFVNKEVAGESLMNKLTHVGVLDSLFPLNTDLMGKLQILQDAIEIKKYNEKVTKAGLKGKKVRELQPRKGKIPDEYKDLHPIKEAAMRKSVLPTLPIDLYSLGAQYSKILVPLTERPMVVSNSGYKTLLLSGEKLRRLDELEGEMIQEDIYVAATCFIVESKEFSFAKNTKRALKLIIDADGYISEKVLWPEYQTGNLVYPSSLKKGAIATLFFRKKAGKKDMSVTGITVETEE